MIQISGHCPAPEEISCGYTSAGSPSLSPLDRSVLVYADPMYKGRERPIARLLPELEPEPARRVGGLVTLLQVNPRCRSTSWSMTELWCLYGFQPHSIRITQSLSQKIPQQNPKLCLPLPYDKAAREWGDHNPQYLPTSHLLPLQRGSVCANLNK